MYQRVETFVDANGEQADVNHPLTNFSESDSEIVVGMYAYKSRHEQYLQCTKQVGSATNVGA